MTVAPLWRKLRKRLPALRDYTPKTLFGRSMLIVALPVLVMQIAVVFMFFDRHWQSASTSLSEGVVGDISVVLELYSENPTGQGLQKVQKLSLEKMNLSVALMLDEDLPTSTHSSFNSPLDRTLRRALAAKLVLPFWFDTNRFPAYVDIRVQVGKDVMRFIAPRDKVYATTGDIFVAWLVAATLILMAVVLLFTRIQLRPILQLSKAADRLGKGLDMPNFKASGPTEVRQASEAFIKMRERISRFVAQRTEMLAGVSHDLRTPLTRLKLQFAMMEKTPELDAARKDVQRMQEMLEGYLDFAQGESAAESVKLDISGMLRELVAQLLTEEQLANMDVSTSLMVRVRAQSIERCLTNILENAVRYADKVWISSYMNDDMVFIIIEDNGPGIPKSDREQAFRPFNRLDEARNLNTEGVGLGLSIARDAVQSHGGHIRLGDSSHGGLLVEVILPASK